MTKFMLRFDLTRLDGCFRKEKVTLKCYSTTATITVTVGKYWNGRHVPCMAIGLVHPADTDIYRTTAHHSTLYWARRVKGVLLGSSSRAG